MLNEKVIAVAEVFGPDRAADVPRSSLAAFTIARMPHPLSVLRAPDAATTGSGPVRLATRQEASQLRCRWHGKVWDHRPPLLSEVVDLLRAEASRTVLELDAKDVEPWPWSRVEALARLVEPVREQVIFGGCADWNLRRLVYVDPRIRVGFTPSFYLDWVPPERDAR